jgi:hypothetical protein
LVWQAWRVVIARIMRMLIEPLTDRPLIGRPKWPVAFGLLMAACLKASGHFFWKSKCPHDPNGAAQLIWSVDLFELVLRKFLDGVWFWGA